MRGRPSRRRTDAAAPSASSVAAPWAAVLRDADMLVIRAYGVAMKGQELAVPAVFIVRRDGTIAYRHVGESMADRPTIDALVHEVGRARLR